MRLRFIMVLVALCVLIQPGCTVDSGVTTPDSVVPRQSDGGHQLWAAVDFSWDGVSEKLSVVPNRSIAQHWNITPWIVPDYITLKVISWDIGTNVLTVEAVMENPTWKDGYDVRGILTNLGDAALLNADDYTKIFDTDFPPVANPFRSFAKDEDGRKFWNKGADPDQYIKLETYEIYFPSGVFATIVVTAAWPDNAAEPYDIENIAQVGSIIEDTGSITLTLDAYDWQDITAGQVIIEANPVTGGDLHMTKTGDTEWEATITNAGGAPPGSYELWIAAWDAIDNNALYNRVIVEVESVSPPWSDPILVSGDPGVNEILPRVVIRGSDVWIIYADENSVLARNSVDGGSTWSSPTAIGVYPNVDTIHAVHGGDDSIYVQYQRSDAKHTYLSKYDGSGWSAPIFNNIIGMTVAPYSCDFGFTQEGTLLDMWTGDWSMFGFTSDNAWDMSSWTNHLIAAHHNSVYSINDGFVQGASISKMFFIHNGTQLEYLSYDGTWKTDFAYVDNEPLIEPAIAPETDGPYHCVVGVTRSPTFSVLYLRFNSWPPTTPDIHILDSGLANSPVFHSISVEGSSVSILFDADGEVKYTESPDGGISFSALESIAGGAVTAEYSHVRRDLNSDRVVAAYAEQIGGDFNIYVKIKG